MAKKWGKTLVTGTGLCENDTKVGVLSTEYIPKQI